MDAATIPAGAGDALGVVESLLAGLAGRTTWRGCRAR